MGHRTLKRVPLNFRWPIRKVWRGYRNPYPGPRDCRACYGSGYNPATYQLAEDLYDSDGFGTRWWYDYGHAPDGRPASRPPWRIVGFSRRWCDQLTQDEVCALVVQGRLRQYVADYVPGKGWVQKTWETRGFWCPSCASAVPQLSPEHHSGYCTACDQAMVLLPGNDVRLCYPLR